jgi:hypothetical protein
MGDMRGLATPALRPILCRWMALAINLYGQSVARHGFPPSRARFGPRAIPPSVIAR